jgi:hypothetical protein
VKNSSFPGVGAGGGGGHKESGNEGEHGRCVLYPYMKTEERNLWKFF